MKPGHVFELLLLAMLWGASFMFMRIAAPEFGAIPLMTVRVFIATLSLLPVLLMTRGLDDIRQNLKPIFIVGIFNSALPFCLLAYAAISFTAGFTSILNATAPLWTALITIFWLKYKSTLPTLSGLIIGFFGVVLMVWDKLSLDQLGSASGLAAGLLATFCYGTCVLYSKKRLAGVNSLAVATGSLAFATILLAPLGIIFWPQQSISNQAWLSVIIMAVASTALANVLFFRLIANVGPSKAITVTYLIPLFGMVFGALLLDEVVTSEMLLGCGLILFGVSLATGLIKTNVFMRKMTE
jgi:drug/metabolite transporter (DMT)-like permease